MVNNLSPGLIVLNDLVEDSKASVMVDNNTAPFLGSFKIIIGKV
jgi:hypothetical protein